MKLFQQSLLPDPLGPILSNARQKKRLSLGQAARNAGISEEEASALEGDVILSAGTARLHAISYARVLGLDTSEIRDSLPPPPVLSSNRNGYLARIANPQGASGRFSPEGIMRLLEALAPLGRAALYLFMLSILLGIWGGIRQLSRVRSIPWVTSNSTPSVFHDR